MTPRTDLSPIQDMIRFAENAIAYAAGLSEPELSADELRTHGLLYAILIVGEASTRVSEATRLRCPEIPWRDIKATRNVLVHRYDWLKMDIVWRTATIHIPAMMPALRAIRDTLAAEVPPPPPEDVPT